MAEATPAPGAWQPFTFGGVARFAYAGIGRLLAVSAFIALLCGAAIAALFALGWAPVIDQSIHVLPEEAVIRNGIFHWPRSAPEKLGGNSFLAIFANPAALNIPKEAAALQIELHDSRFILRFLVGYTPIPYPRDYIISLDKSELGPLWGAWKPALISAVLIASMLLLMLSWAILALLYAPIAALIAFYCDRRLRFTGAWKLACAALLPGAVLMSFGTFLYALGEITPLLFSLIAAAHLLLGWIYLLFSPLCLDPLPGTSSARRRHPFQSRAG